MPEKKLTLRETLEKRRQDLAHALGRPVTESWEDLLAVASVVGPSTLPPLGDGFTWLTLVLPVLVSDPADAEAVAPVLAEAYTQAVKEMSGG